MKKIASHLRKSDQRQNADCPNAESRFRSTPALHSLTFWMSVW